MTEKQTILGRISQLTRANINALLDRAEDPEKMLNQLVIDYTNNIREAETAIAQTIGNLRLAEADHAEDVQAAADFGTKAQNALTRAEQFRSAGDAAQAEKFDQLARKALSLQITHENDAKQAAPQIAQQAEIVEKLKAGLETMKGKLTELHTKRDQLVARQRTADAQQKVNEAVGSINILDPTSEVSRFEERVRRQEALVQGQSELAAASLDSQFDELEASATELEIEARLAELRGAAAPASSAVEAGSGEAQAASVPQGETQTS